VTFAAHLRSLRANSGSTRYSIEMPAAGGWSTSSSATASTLEAVLRAPSRVLRSRSETRSSPLTGGMATKSLHREPYSDADAGSDGDIFTHSFKQLGLGPVVGTRTWGGVIGIWPRHPLVDGTLVSQPEFAFWFADAKWGVENYGVAPDVEVEILPDEWAAGRDPQLDKAIELALAALEQAALPVPDLSRRPRLPLPVLPPRGPVA